MSVQNEEGHRDRPRWLFFCLRPAIPKNPGDLASNQLAIVLGVGIEPTVVTERMHLVCLLQPSVYPNLGFHQGLSGLRQA